jgi:hypothetical protein
MKKKKFSESQIITVLKEYGAGVPAQVSRYAHEKFRPS